MSNVSSTAAQGGAIYYLAAPLVPWLWPSLILAGIALQLLALYFKKRWPGGVGLVLAMAGAIAERDLSLGVGIILVSLGLWFCAEKN